MEALMEVIKSKLVIFLGFPLVFLFVVDSFPIQKQFSGICSEVLDGDTIIVKGKRIRFFGIDAPEKSQRALSGERIGEWSTSYLKKLILGKRVSVTYYKKGFYGRIIGEIWMDENINLKMLEEGMAVKANQNRNRSYINVEYVARLERKGIFGTLGFETPWFYRKRMRNEINR
jgi:endonuclease YncB( thermonuclease family)